MNGHDLGQGIYFALRDYASFSRRMVIILIDASFLFLVGVILVVAGALASSFAGEIVPAPRVVASLEQFVALLTLAWLGFAYLYLTLLRGSRLRTLDYILTGTKIVNLKGERPSFGWMNLRLFMWFLAPLNAVVDLLWFWGDENRQMLRDKLAGTYVVKMTAVPIGAGPIRASTLFVLGSAVVHPEVKRPAPAAIGPSTRDLTTPLRT